MNEFQQISRSPGPRLTLLHLMMIQAIDQTGSLSRAAETLAVTPSALSHRLSEAERRLGTALVHREGRRARLTPAGRMCLRAANEVLDIVRQAEGDVARLRGDAFDRVLRLTCGHYGDYGWFGAFLEHWRDAHPTAHVQIRGDCVRDPLAALTDRRVDVAIMPYAADARHRREGVASAPLCDDALVLICAPSDPIAEAGETVTEMFKDRDFLTYTRVEVPGQEYARLFRPRNLTVRRWVDMEAPCVIPDLVARGMGVSILSRHFVMRAVEAGRVVALPLGDGGLPITWHAHYRKGDAADPLLTALLEALARAFKPGM